MTKKKILVAGLGLLISANASAQSINLKGPAQNLANELKGAFPLIAVCIFIICILFNLGNFVHGDWKKGIINILLYTLLISAVVGLVAYVGSIKL